MVGKVSSIYGTHLSDTDRFIKIVIINGHPKKFEVDSGSAHIPISKEDFHQFVWVLYIEPFFVVSNGCSTLLGRTCIIQY